MARTRKSPPLRRRKNRPVPYEQLGREELIRQLAISESARRTLERRLADETDQREALREAVEQLETSHRRYLELYDFAPVAYCTLDGAGTVLAVNQTGATLLDVRAKHVVGKPFAALLLTGADRALFTKHLHEAHKSSRPVTVEVSVATKRGLLDVQLVTARARNYAGESDEFRIAILDISQRRQAERRARAAHESETRLRQRLERLDHASLVISAALARPMDPDELLYVILDELRAVTETPCVALRLGDADPPEQWIVSGRRSDCTPPMTGFSMLPLRYLGEQRGTLYVAHKDGVDTLSPEDRLLVELLAQRVATAMEITRLRQIEAREHVRLELLAKTGPLLAESIDFETTLATIARMLVPALADLSAVDIVNDDGSITKSAIHHPDREKQRLLVRLLGTIPAAAVPANVRATIETARLQPIDVALLRGALGKREYHELLDRIRPTASLLVPMVVRGRVVGLLRLVMAESGRRFREDDLPLIQEVAMRAGLALEAARLFRQAQTAISARDNLLAAVTHDVGNYMSAMALATDLISLYPAHQDRRRGRKQIDSIARALTRMRALIASLRDATMIETGHFTVEPKTENVAELLSDLLYTLEPQAQARAIRLHVDAAERGLFVSCDRERVLQVMANLVGNALKFTPSPGEVCVAAQPIGDVIRFSVSDTGEGIPDETRARVFERYFSASHSTGLGLYIARGIVEAHGGHIWLESRAGRGSTFSFTVPAAQPDPQRLLMSASAA